MNIKKLKSTLDNMGLNQKDLSKRTGIHHGIISDIFSGKKEFHRRYLVKIVNALNFYDDGVAVHSRHNLLHINDFLGDDLQSGLSEGQST